MEQFRFPNVPRISTNRNHTISKYNTQLYDNEHIFLLIYSYPEQLVNDLRDVYMSMLIDQYGHVTVIEFIGGQQNKIVNDNAANIIVMRIDDNQTLTTVSDTSTLLYNRLMSLINNLDDLVSSVQNKQLVKQSIYLLKIVFHGYLKTILVIIYHRHLQICILTYTNYHSQTNIQTLET